ncbi:MAG: GerMN domain-containing protein [Clostridiales bacterium]|nr:GerMN domain-containing protein [Clostridiales bacterium]
MFLISCSKDNTNGSKDISEESQYKIYYLDATQTSIVSDDYKAEQEDSWGLIEELMEVLSTNPQSSSMKKAKPDAVVMQGYRLTEDGRLTIEFSSEYSELSGIMEVLCRAAIVKTLSQIEGVDYIEFTIGGQPLMDSKGKPVGLMENKDFINSTHAENVFVTVYFSNEEGGALLPSNLRITYDGNIPIVELILNRLILGPVEENMIGTIPENTILNSVTTKEGICYVDFSADFLNYNPNIKPEVVIYSIVNSLVELSYVNRVQFTINGSIVEDYNGIPFNGIFERKLELIDESS